MMKKLFLLTIVCLAASLFIYAQDISGTYAIKNVETGIYMRIKDANKKDGTPIVAYSPVNWKCVTWDFNKKQANTYQLRNLFSDKTLQPVSNPGEGVALEEKPLNNGDANQQYQFIPVEKNVYLIKLKDKDLYLTPSDSKGEINNPIVLKKKAAGKIQQWTLVEQHPEI